MCDSLLQDVRYGFRALLKDRSFALAAILSIALGVGVNSAIFSIADGMLFRPLPYPHANRLVTFLEEDNNKQTSLTIARPAVDALRLGTSFEAMSFEALGPRATAAEFIDTLIVGDKPIRVHGYGIDPQLLSVLGAEPNIGRPFTVDDVHGGAEQAGLLMPQFWRQLGGDPRVVGSTLRLEGRSVRVVGVMPAGFNLPKDIGSLQADVLVPIGDVPSAARVAWPIARLKPGIALAQAQAEAQALTRGALQPRNDAPGRLTIRVKTLQNALFESTQSVLVALVGAAGFVLLIVCANVSSLLLVRGTARTRELAVRTAIGASRLRLLRQLVVENLVLALVGGAAGLLVAYATFDVVYSLVPGRVYRLFPATIDRRVVLFAAGISVMTGLLVGATPALRFSRTDISQSLRKGSGMWQAATRISRASLALIVAEVALVVMLLAGAGLMVKSFVRLRTVDLGLRPDHVEIISVRLPPTRYPQAAADVFYRQLVERVSAVPGVEAAAGVDGEPLLTLGSGLAPSGNGLSGATWLVTPGYFKTFGIPLVAGRTFTDAEWRSDAPVAVLSESAARARWPNGDALGRTIVNGPDRPRQIVGIVGDVRRTQTRPAEPIMYRPIDVATSRFMYVAVRTRNDPRSVVVQLTAAVRSLDPKVLVSVRSYADDLGQDIAVPRFQTVLFSVFGLLGLTLAAVGIFGVVGYLVSYRTHEIGVRMALGADAAAIRAMVVRQALMPVGAGLGAGLVGTYWTTQMLARWLFEVQPHDPSTLVSVTVLLVGTAFAASYLPARRASRVDPIEALRAE